MKPKEKRNYLNLIDNFGRNIDYLRLSVTDRCNLRCFYCNPYNIDNLTYLKRSEVLSFEEIILSVKILTELGIKKVKITGGEPLIKDNIIYLIKKIKGINKIEDVSITTNGLFLGKYLRELKSAGVERLNISIDSLDEKNYSIITGGGNLKIVLNNLFSAINLGFNEIKINTVVTSFLNRNDIINFINLVKSFPISVRFIEQMPILKVNNNSSNSSKNNNNNKNNNNSNSNNNNNNNSSSNSNNNYNNNNNNNNDDGDVKAIVSTKANNTKTIKTKAIDVSSNKKFNLADILKIIEEDGSCYKAEEKKGFGPAVYYKSNAWKGYIGFIENNENSCSYCNRIRLTAEGKLKICLFSDIQYDLKSKLRNNTHPNLIKKDIVEFVKTKPINRNFLKCTKNTKIDESCLGEIKEKIPQSMNIIGG